MRLLSRSTLPAVLALALLSCADSGPLDPPPAPLAAVSAAAAGVRVSEIHYDNAGTDAGEAIEISGPAGTDLTGWQLLLYNGANGAVYHTTNLTQTLPATCGARGVIVIGYAVNGIQNGEPDGWALVDAAGTVVEFMSYEGTFAAAGGPALGMTSIDIGVRQAGTEPIGSSLHRNAAGVWSVTQPLGTNTFGACNDNDGPPAGPPATVTVEPATASVAANATAQFTASAVDADGNPSPTNFVWTSSDETVATVGAATGLATGVAPGVATITATAGNGVTGSATLTVTEAPPPVDGLARINEIHYDNVGVDVGEAIEIEGPAGLDLTGWQLILYNGNGGASYNTQVLNGPIPATCGERGVIVVGYASNGIQNGSPDGMALVNAAGQVVEFLSYEGTFTATNGPALGMLSVDIGVNQNPDNSVPSGLSLQRGEGASWYGPASATFGACNTAPEPPPPGAPLAINEIMADPLNAAGGASWGEWFEVHNHGTEALDLNGWTIVSAGQPSHTIAASVVVAAGGYAVLGRGADSALNGGITLDYNYFTGGTTIFLDATDVLVLRDAAGVTADSVRWTNSATFVRGSTRGVRDVALDNANVDGANWGYSTVTFGDGDYGTPGAPNGELSDTPPHVPNSISFSGRLPNEPALPVGFEDQLFATLRDGTGTVVPTTFTWTSLTPATASIDARGVLRSLAPGSATIRATAEDGTTGTYTLPTRIAEASGTAAYEGNAEFGEPDDGDPSDDYILRRPQFITSYNAGLGTPNWVAYNLEASHFGPEDRCDCFTFDDDLPAAFPRYNTADYTGAGAYHGYGIDRGHLVRSFDRTGGSLDNAYTFYFSNIVPQAADNNQGPWAIFENHLGNLARFQNREVYVIAGVAGSKGTVKDEGLITIPAHVWKVAVIMPRDEGLEHVHGHEDLEVVAVIMPNEPGVRNVPWQTYLTTVDAVEALTGYDLLALLPDHIEIAVESGTKPPTAILDGPYSGTEGSPVALSGAASSDPDGHALTFAWSFGDGATASGESVNHTWTQDGAYTVRLIVTDVLGLADTTTTTANVANVAPVIAPLAGAALLPGETYATTGSFTDPGADAWTATVDYGDGTGVAPLALSGRSFSLSHEYGAPGSYTVTVTVNDGAATATATATVTVGTPLAAVKAIGASVDALVQAGRLSNGNANALQATLNAAATQITSGNHTAARNQLGAFINQVEAFTGSGQLSAEDGEALIEAAERVIASITP